MEDKIDKIGQKIADVIFNNTSKLTEIGVSILFISAASALLTVLVTMFAIWTASVL
jgi:hypothetical protein